MYTETLFKSSSEKGETFLDQQFWLYFYGALASAGVHAVSDTSYGLASLLADTLGESVLDFPPWRHNS